MCGFCGVIGPSRTAGVEDIEAMTLALRHRGPDDHGTWRRSFRSGGHEWDVALGNTRLAILDLSPEGHQPMAASEGGSVIAYNGEVYNHRALRSELEREGTRFRSTCDTEVVLKAYERWGLDAFQRFNGMFALAIWDDAAQRLVLARDRMGIKPLHYRRSGDTLSFGSELGALRCHRAFRPKISAVALETYLRYGWLTGMETIYEDTYRLLPGHVLLWEGGSISTIPYWKLVDIAPRTERRDFASVTDELEGLLGDAVEARMISDVPLGAFLSGGVDSSTIVALMQERSQRPVRTFSIGFEQEEFDEAPHARAVAKHLGTEHTELYVRHQESLAVLRELPLLYDEPHSDPSAIPTVLLSRLARESVTVALSGDGGDELFGGYRRYARLRTLLPLLQMPAGTRRLLLSLSQWLGPASLRNGLLKLDRASDPAALAETFHCGFDEETLRTACRRDGPRPMPVFQEIFRQAQNVPARRRAMFAEARTYLNDDVLVKLDRASMSVGLEARVPLLDHRVVEFAFGLPLRLLTHGGETKAPLRSVLYRRVPRKLIDRPKQGFGFPVGALLGAELKHWTRRYLDPTRIAEEGNLDPTAVTRMVSGTERGGVQAESELWRLICFERWLAWNHRGETDA